MILNATVTQPAGPGYLTIFPDGVSRPLASDYAAGQTRPNLVIVGVGTPGARSACSRRRARTSCSTWPVGSLSRTRDPSAQMWPRRAQRFLPASVRRILDRGSRLGLGGDAGPVGAQDDENFGRGRGAAGGRGPLHLLDGRFPEPCRHPQGVGAMTVPVVHDRA